MAYNLTPFHILPQKFLFFFLEVSKTENEKTLQGPCCLSVQATTKLVSVKRPSSRTMLYNLSHNLEYTWRLSLISLVRYPLNMKSRIDFPHQSCILQACFPYRTNVLLNLYVLHPFSDDQWNINVFFLLP